MVEEKPEWEPRATELREPRPRRETQSRLTNRAWWWL